ncbi:sulfotransferase [Verrucomicrobiaceae bacterium 227]
MTLEQKLKKATELARSGEADRAISFFVELVEARPENVQLRIYLAKCLGLVFQFEECELLLENLLKATGRAPEVLVETAKTWEELDRADLSLGFWEEAARSEKVPGAWSQVARLSERFNRLPEAKEALEQGSKKGEAGPCWHWVKGRVAQREGCFEDALREFSLIFERSPESDWGQQAGHGMAAVFEKLGEFQRAWEILKKVKNRRESTARKLARANALPKASVVAGGSDFEPKNSIRGLTLLGGFPRSGTTLTCRLLGEATGLPVSDESLAMDRALRLAKAGAGRRAHSGSLHAAREGYEEAMRVLLGGVAMKGGFIDKNPAMALWYPWLSKIFPEMRLLWVSRDWREVALSCWFTSFPLNALTASFRSWSALSEVLELASQHLKYIQEDAPAGGFHRVNYDELVSTGGLPKATLEFVSQGADLPCGRSAFAAKGFINSPTYAEAVRPPSSDRLGRWKNYYQFAPQFFDALEQLER